jgi:hypothetical protein
LVVFSHDNKKHIYFSKYENKHPKHTHKRNSAMVSKDLKKYEQVNWLVKVSLLKPFVVLSGNQ